jgi:hypothetical protein
VPRQGIVAVMAKHFLLHPRVGVARGSVLFGQTGINKKILFSARKPLLLVMTFMTSTILGCIRKEEVGMREFAFLSSPSLAAVPAEAAAAAALVALVAGSFGRLQRRLRAAAGEGGGVNGHDLRAEGKMELQAFHGAIPRRSNRPPLGESDKRGQTGVQTLWTE